MTTLDTQLVEAIEKLHNGNPRDWKGEMHLHIAGKTGELFFFLGVLPALRDALSNATFLVYTLQHYLPVIRWSAHQPDAATGYEQIMGLHADTGLIERGLQVTAKTAFPGFGVKIKENQIHVNVYRTHAILWTDPRVSAEDTPFYRSFMEAVGIPDAKFTRPAWQPDAALLEEVNRLRGSKEPAALVFSVGNAHAQVWKDIPLSPSQWQELADLCRHQGLQPLMCAHADDQRIDTPGWTWFDTNRVELVLTLLASSERVIGMNSGIVFAATCISPGKVTMFDPLGSGLYRFGNMIADGVIDPLRHIQIPISSDLDVFASVRDACT